MSSRKLDCDVVVVGAGPVGMLTALLLHQFGHSVQILERRPQRWDLPRAVTCHSQILRVLQALGLLEQMLEAKAIYAFRPHLSDYCEWFGADGSLLAKIPFNGPYSRSGMDAVYGLNQMLFDQILEQTCVEKGIPVRRGIEVFDVDNAEDHVEVAWRKYVANGETAVERHPKRVTALFAVGCDGARSALREAAGIHFLQQSSGQYRWFVLDVVPTPDTGHYDWKDEGFFRQFNDPKRPSTSAPSLGFRRRLEFMLLPHEPNEIIDSDEFVWSLIRDYGCTPTNSQIVRRSVFSPKGGWVDSFFRGRVVLAGDSAHNTPQFLGTGVNMGLRDAKSLAWRLDLAIKHPCLVDLSKLLNDYSTEQRGCTEKLVTMALDVEKVITVTDPAEARIRDIKLSNAPIAEGYPDVEALGAPGAYMEDVECVHAGKETGGNLFIHDIVSYKGTRGPFDTVLGQGWILLGAGPENPATLLEEATQLQYRGALKGSPVQLTGDDSFDDITGRYADWFTRNGAYAVLVRPDFYIYAVARTRAEVNFIVQKALRHIFSSKHTSPSL